MNSPYKGKFKVTQQFKGSSHDGLDLVGIDSKKIYSTVEGTVEYAGWENKNDKKQGFGLYVRIKQKGSENRYYFGHLSSINVSVGQSIEQDELIGVEGSTGKSTGSHCHYCIRGNASKSLIRDVTEISGIPNRIGTFAEETPKIVKKTVTQIAKEVIEGKWGNGDDRRSKLKAAGYDYNKIQEKVNQLLLQETAKKKKSNTEIAKEVIAGKWGNGEERKNKLKAAGYSYSAVQTEVNKLLK